MVTLYLLPLFGSWALIYCKWDLLATDGGSLFLCISMGVQHFDFPRLHWVTRNCLGPHIKCIIHLIHIGCKFCSIFFLYFFIKALKKKKKSNKHKTSEMFDPVLWNYYVSVWFDGSNYKSLSVLKMWLWSEGYFFSGEIGLIKAY